jgi:UDP-glucose 4-epimerase
MNDRLRSILVTGAAGLLGSHLVEMLISKGYQVTGIDNLSIGTMDNLTGILPDPNFNFVQCDVREHEVLRQLDCHDAIVHLAAYKIEVPGLKGTDILKVNSFGTASMLDLAREWHSRFFFASTSDVYGRNPNMPFNEDDNLVLGKSTVSRWGYAASKIFDEHLCFAYQREFGLDVTVIRYFNTYGPRHELSRKSGGPQALFLDALIKGGKMTIHGDGSQKRCFAYISDSIEMTVRAMESDRTSGEILNIGNPHTEISILDLALLAYEITGGKNEPPIEFVSHNEAYQTGQFQEVSRRIPDISKAVKLLRYSPQIGNREGLVKTFEWQRHLPGYSQGRT